MERKIPILTFNVDLKRDVFRTASAAFLEHIVEVPEPNTPDIDVFCEVVGAESVVHVALFFERSLEATQRDMGATESELNKIFKTLTEKQIHLSVGAVMLIDCGEVGMCPISQFVIIQNMIECISGFVNDDTERRVYALDSPEDDRAGNPAQIFDTSTASFRDRLWAHFDMSLSSLNEDFGATPLPKF